jgi:hypothetical protein
MVSAGQKNVRTALGGRGDVFFDDVKTGGGAMRRTREGWWSDGGRGDM